MLLLAMLAFSAVLTTPAQAARLTSVTMGLGDTKPSTAGNMSWTFTTATAITGDTTDDNTDMKIVIRFPTSDAFAIASGLTASDATITGLPTGGAIVAGATGVDESNSGGTAAADTITINVDLTNSTTAATLSASTQLVVNIINDKITNPAKSAAAGTADLYDISIETQNSSSTVQDTGASRIAIQDAQSVSATVNTTMSFTIAAVSSGSACTNGNADVTSTATTVPFGTLAPNTAKAGCQTLTIATNAPNGYNLYITQNGNLIAGSDDIDQFKNGTRIDDSAATAWTSPAVSAQDESTHGHLGYNSNDTDVFASSTTYAGIPIGPASGASPVVTGLACKNTAATTSDTCKVDFKVEISALQPAGSYTAEFQYFLVPTY